MEIRALCASDERSTFHSGDELLRFVLKLAAKMADELACAAVVVDAKPAAVASYAKYGFAPFEPLEGQSDAHPHATAMYLMMADIKAASGPVG